MLYIYNHLYIFITFFICVEPSTSTLNVLHNDIVTVETSDEEINKLEQAFGKNQRIHNKKPNPTTFTKNWSIHGSQADIIPDILWNSEPPTKRGSPPLSTHTLKQALLHFTKSYRCSEYHSRYPPILLFCFKYKVP